MGVSERFACRLTGQNRTTQRHKPAAQTPADPDGGLRRWLRDYAKEDPGWGFLNRNGTRNNFIGWCSSSTHASVRRRTEPNTAVIVAEREDARTDGPMTGEERAVLDHWLDLYRDTVLLKIVGLDGDQLARQSVPPSFLSLIGVVRHLTGVEAYWLRVVLLNEEDVPDYYRTPASPDGDFDDVDRASAAADVEAYRAELTTTRANAARWTDLDMPARGLRKNKAVNLRWIFVHLIEEYARQLGHMDLLREAVDGRTGY